MDIKKFQISDADDTIIGYAYFEPGEFFDLSGNLVGKLRKPRDPYDVLVEIYDGNNANIGTDAWEIGPALGGDLVGYMGSTTEILDRNHKKVGSVSPPPMASSALLLFWYIFTSRINNHGKIFLFSFIF